MPNSKARVADSSQAGMLSGVELSARKLESNMTDAWGVKSISWRLVLKYQDYLNLLLTIGFIIGLVIANSEQPLTYRPFLDYDATISYAYKGSSTIPYWVAIVVPLILMLLSFLVGELLLARAWHGALTSAVATVLFFLIDGISAFIVTGFATQVTKVGVGRLRPDFLSRCQPQVDSSNVTIQWGVNAASNPACTPGAISDNELKEGHYSFPSGHTSTVFVFAVYASVYCIYAFYYRIRQQPPTAKGSGSATPTVSSSGAVVWGGGTGRRTWAARWMRDLCGVLGLCFILVQMGFAWGVGASRIVDNKHHPSDVVAGAVLGSAVGLLYVMRAIPRHRRLDELDESDAEATPAAPLLGSGPGGMQGLGPSDTV